VSAEKRKRETRWQLVVLLATQGQNRHFAFHLLLGDCGEDGVVRAWRSVLRRRVRRGRRPWRIEGPRLVHGREDQRALLPFSPSPCPNLPRFPLLRTLAVGDEFLQIPIDSGRVFHRQLIARAPLDLFYIAGLTTAALSSIPTSTLT
jgi:hypothetical protein